jgi:hypothetical protein
VVREGWGQLAIVTVGPDGASLRVFGYAFGGAEITKALYVILVMMYLMATSSNAG